VNDKLDLILLYVPCGSEDEARRIAGLLLREHLIACGNIYESRSLYYWKGELADEPEQVLLCKTTPARAAAAATRIRQVHSYDSPCILRIEPASANHEYASWVHSEVSKGADLSSSATPGGLPRVGAGPESRS